LKFGICVYNWEPFSYTPKLYEELAVESENLGYDSFFVTDHFLRPHAPAGIKIQQNATIEAWSLLSYLAGKTNTIKLGTAVSPIPLRRPKVLAKIVATVDILSEGRVILGADWHPPGERVDMTKEGIELMKKLWAEDVVNYEGTFFKAKNVVCEPKPKQKGGPPVWVGAIHDKMLKLTADLADGWFPGRAVGATVEHYADSVPKIKEEMRKIGRTQAPTMGLMGYFVERSAPLALPAISSIDKATEMIQKYKEIGCEYLAAMFFPVEKFKQMMREFSKDIVPSFS
jgi:alkanesulfonate monooxygenase SsuD/methylene tetrahydromethanopterin reductase-like flavin-dependent oxidoreductase (luciferase family)